MEANIGDIHFYLKSWKVYPLLRGCEGYTHRATYTNKIQIENLFSYFYIENNFKTLKQKIYTTYYTIKVEIYIIKLLNSLLCKNCYSKINQNNLKEILEDF